MLHSAITINIDDVLAADVQILDIDEAMSHYEVRSEYSKQLGAAMAVKQDQVNLQLACLAGRTAAPQDDMAGGSQLSGTNVDTDGQAMAELIFGAREIMAEKYVPETDPRAFFCRPAIYSLLAMTTDILNKNWGGSGVYADGKIFRIAGFDIVETMHVPNSNITQETGANNTYHGDFTNTVGVCVSKGAVGNVYLKGLTTEIADQDYKVENQAVLLVVKRLMGAGILEARRAVELLKQQ